MSTLGKFLWLLLASVAIVRADPGAEMGSGNFNNGETGSTVVSQHNALMKAGAKMARFAIYPAWYWVNGVTKETLHDAAIRQAYTNGITPTFSFEHEGLWTNNLLGYTKWYDIGRNFALRFSPNSAWLTNQGIYNWGVNVYQAINEPDLTNNTSTTKWPPVPLTGTNSYYSALEGLADGVHSVNANLAVLPGGWGSPNAYGSGSGYRCSGYAGAVAPLINSGKLAGFDLHTYMDIFYAPIVTSSGNPTFNFSPQHNFDRVKLTNGITAGCDFYCTEFNFKKDTAVQSIDEALAARRYLTCIWGNLGVVKNDGFTRATKVAFTWNIFNTTTSDDWYGLSTQLSPTWLPTLRGQVLTNVIYLSSGMEFVALSKTRGEFILAGNGKKLWVWQNYQNWSSVYGSSYTASGIPAGATTLKVYGWDGLRLTIQLSGQSSYNVTGLAANETYMFQVTVLSVPVITNIVIAGGTVRIHFTTWEGDVATSFKLQSCATPTGTFADDNVAIITGSAGAFQTTTALNGSARFYRIRR